MYKSYHLFMHRHSHTCLIMHIFISVYMNIHRYLNLHPRVLMGVEILRFFNTRPDYFDLKLSGIILRTCFA